MLPLHGAKPPVLRHRPLSPLEGIQHEQESEQEATRSQVGNVKQAGQLPAKSKTKQKSKHDITQVLIQAQAHEYVSAFL